MYIAHELGMINGEYAFIVLRLFEGDNFGKFTWKGNDQYDEVSTSTIFKYWSTVDIGESVLFPMPVAKKYKVRHNEAIWNKLTNFKGT